MGGLRKACGCRHTERTFGSIGPGCAKLGRAGVNLQQQHFGEEVRFENDSVLLAMAGIIATRAESAEAAQATGAVSQAIYCHVGCLVAFFCSVKLHSYSNWNPASKK